MSKMAEDVAFTPIQPYDPKNNTYVKEKNEYHPTLCEWAAKNREQVIAYKLVNTSTSVTAYVVPEGFTFYLTGYVHHIRSGVGAGLGRCYSAVYILSASSKQISAVQIDDSIVGNSMNSERDLTMPIVLRPNESITISNNSNTNYASITIFGFLEPLAAL